MTTEKRDCRKYTEDSKPEALTLVTEQGCSVVEAVRRTGDKALI